MGGLRSKCTDLEHVQEQLKADLAREKEYVTLKALSNQLVTSR